MKTKLTSLLAVSILITACSGHAPSSQAGTALPVSVARPEVRTIVLTKQYPGYLVAEQTVDLVARVSGTLQRVAYTPGSRVQAGQVLFVIEPTTYEDDVRQAEAALETARAQLEYAENNYARMQEAVKSDAVSRLQVQQAKSNVATSKAAVSNAEAALNSARTRLGYCTVRAPFSGRVSRSRVDAGSYVGGSASPVTLATLYKDDRLYSYFNIADNQWLQMTLAQGSDSLLRTATVHTPEGRAGGYPATLDYLSPNVDLQTGTLNLRVRLDNREGLLKSGLYVDITLPYGEARDALLVPDASIGTDQLGKYLYVVTDSDTVRYRHIETGQLVDDSLRQVVSGLAPQERYVTRALLKVRDGMKIQPINK